MPGKTRWMAAACGLMVIATGCGPDLKPTNAKLEKAINGYYEEHNECLFPGGRKFPYEVSPGTDAKEEKTQMDAMMDADLVNSQQLVADRFHGLGLVPVDIKVSDIVWHPGT